MPNLLTGNVDYLFLTTTKNDLHSAEAAGQGLKEFLSIQAIHVFRDFPDLTENTFFQVVHPAFRAKAFNDREAVGGCDRKFVPKFIDDFILVKENEKVKRLFREAWNDFGRKCLV